MSNENDREAAPPSPETPGEPDPRIDRSMVGFRGRRRVAEILVDEGLVTPGDLQKALEAQKKKLGEIVVEIGACKPEDLEKALELQRMGLTRAQRYGKRLRVALAVILMMTIALCAGLIHLTAATARLVRIQQATLTIEGVGDIVAEPMGTQAADALRSLDGRLNDPRAAVVLASALRHDKWYVRMYAAVLAKKMDNKILIAPLIMLLTDPEKIVIPVAQDALESITRTKLGGSPQAWADYARKQGLLPQRPQSPNY
jgi:hypothetical protein